jgi:hypothetical protein
MWCGDNTDHKLNGTISAVNDAAYKGLEQLGTKAIDDMAPGASELTPIAAKVVDKLKR